MAYSPENSRSLRPRIWFCLIAIILSGFYLYTNGLGRDSLWYDEASTVVLAYPFRPLIDLLIARSTLAAPLPYLLESLALAVGSQEYLLRLPQVFSAILLVVATFRLGRRLFGTRVGLLAAGLTAVSPLLVRYSQEVRYYTLLGLLFVLTTEALDQVLQQRRLTWRYVGLALLMVTTHPLAWLALVSHGVWGALSWLSGRRSLIHQDNGWIANNRSRLMISLACVIVMLVSIGWTGWRLQEDWQSGRQRGGVDFSPIRTSAGIGYGRDLSLSEYIQFVYVRSWRWFATPTSLGTSNSVTMIASGIPTEAPEVAFLSLLLTVGGFLFSCKTARKRVLFVGVQTWLPLSLIALVTELQARYFFVDESQFAIRRILFELPLFYLAVAYGALCTIGWILHRLPSRVYRPGRAALLAGLLLAVSWLPMNVQILKRYYAWSRDDWRSAAAYLSWRVQPGEPILVNDANSFVLLNYYLRNSLVKAQLQIRRGENVQSSLHASRMWWVTDLPLTHPLVAGYEPVQQFDADSAGRFRVYTAVPAGQVQAYYADQLRDAATLSEGLHAARMWLPGHPQADAQERNLAEGYLHAWQVTAQPSAIHKVGDFDTWLDAWQVAQMLGDNQAQEFVKSALKEIQPGSMPISGLRAIANDFASRNAFEAAFQAMDLAFQDSQSDREVMSTFYAICHQFEATRGVSVATEWYTQQANAAPQHLWYSMALAASYLHAGRINESIRLYQDLMSRFADPGLYLGLAETQAQAPDLGESVALATLREGIKRFPDSTEISATLGKLLAENMADELQALPNLLASSETGSGTRMVPFGNITSTGQNSWQNQSQGELWGLRSEVSVEPGASYLYIVDWSVEDSNDLGGSALYWDYSIRPLPWSWQIVGHALFNIHGSSALRHDVALVVVPPHVKQITFYPLLLIGQGRMYVPQVKLLHLPNALDVAHP